MDLKIVRTVCINLLNTISHSKVLDDKTKTELNTKIVDLISKAFDPRFEASIEDELQTEELADLDLREVKILLTSKISTSILGGQNPETQNKVAEVVKPLLKTKLQYPENTNFSKKNNPQMLPVALFKELSDLDPKSISPFSLMQSFKSEIEKKFSGKIFYFDKKAINFLSNLFLDTLVQIKDKLELKGLKPESALDKFKSEFYEQLELKKTTRETITREMFNDLIKEGFRESALDLSDPHVKELKNSLRSGDWKEDELKELTINEIDKGSETKLMPFVEKIFNSEDFINIMQDYFSSFD